jgi:SAM-dependent methyltransferase
VRGPIALKALNRNDAFNRAAYGGYADRYAAYRPTYPDELFDAIYQHVGVFGTALDCATGTGQAAQHLSRRFEKVLAFDNSARQVQHAQEGFLRFVASAEAVPLRDRVADLITVAQAVHWFDLEQFWPEVHRLGRAGSVLAIWGYGFFKVDAAVDEVVMRELRSQVDRYWGSGNLILLDEYRTITFPFEELSAPQLTMVENWTLDRLLAYLSTWSALNRYEHEHGAGLLEHARQELSKIWPPGETREVRMPITMRIGRVLASA